MQTLDAQMDVRKQVWIKAWVAAMRSGDKFNRPDSCIVADVCLKEFDKRFPIMVEKVKSYG